MQKKKTPRRIIVQPYDFSVQDIVNKIENEEINLSPEYQRNYIWDSDDEHQNKCSRLIESLLLNIPIPVIYFAEQEETLKYEVIDGQQRLYTFQRYLKDDFHLKNLEIRDDLNGLKYSELEQKDKDEIRKRSIRAIVILNESDDEIKYEVFERLNLGSIQLTPQEIRNNTLRGSFNELLKELAANPLFQNTINLRFKKDQNNMSHEELVLRFFAYQESGSKRVLNLNYFLTNFMKKYRNANDKEINNFRHLFTSTLDLIHKYLGDNAFKSYSNKTKKWVKSTNKSLYDAQMLAFSQFIDKNIDITPEDFIEKFKVLMDDNIYKKSLHAQASNKMMEDRVSGIKNIILNKVD